MYKINYLTLSLFIGCAIYTCQASNRPQTSANQLPPSKNLLKARKKYKISKFTVIPTVLGLGVVAGVFSARNRDRSQIWQEGDEMLNKKNRGTQKPPNKANSTLIDATQENNEELIGTSSNTQVDSRKKDELGDTALTTSVSWQKKVDEMLSKENTSIEELRKEGSFPLMHAAEENNVELVDILINAQVDLREKDKYGDTALISLVSFGNKKSEESEKCILIIKKLIEADKKTQKQGKLVDIADMYNNTPLICAIKSSGETKKQKVALLIEAGADVNKPGKNGEMPLYKAIERGCYEVAKSLIAAKADLNVGKFKNGSLINTNLHKAIHKYCLSLRYTQEGQEFITLLLEAGADPTKKDWRKETAIDSINNGEDRAIFSLPEYVKIPLINKLKVAAEKFNSESEK